MNGQLLADSSLQPNGRFGLGCVKTVTGRPSVEVALLEGLLRRFGIILAEEVLE